MPTCFLDLDSRAPLTKSFKVLELDPDSAPWNVSIASIMLFCFISPEYSLIICDPNPATSARGVTFLAVEQAVDKLLAWVVKGTSAYYVPVVYLNVLELFRTFGQSSLTA